MLDNPKPMNDDEILAMEEVPMTIRLAKSQVMSIRLTADELRTVANAARDARMTVGVFMKQAVIDAAQFRRLAARPKLQIDYPSSGITYYGTAQLTGIANAGASLGMEWVEPVRAPRGPVTKVR